LTVLRSAGSYLVSACEMPCFTAPAWPAHPAWLAQFFRLLER